MTPMSPFEVERQEFGRAPFGYRAGEVRRFLDEVRTTLIELWQERTDLRDENERLRDQMRQYTDLEEQMKKTLLLAQDTAERARESARHEAEVVLRDAGQKAREIVHGAHQQRQRYELDVKELALTEQETRQRLSSLAHALIAHLDDSDTVTKNTTNTMRAVIEDVDNRALVEAQKAQQLEVASQQQVAAQTGARQPTTA